MMAALQTLTVAPVRSTRPPALPLTEAVDRSAAGEVGLTYVQSALAMHVYLEREGDDEFGPQPTPREELPDPVQWSSKIAQAILEVITGARQVTQVVRWMQPQAYAVVAQAAQLSARQGARRGGRTSLRRLQVGRVDVCEPADGVAEVALIVRDGERVRAMAMRLVGEDGRWRVNTLQLG